MPGGHASHKGSSIKPNTNAAGKIDTAADSSTSPEDVLTQESLTGINRTQEHIDYPPALERPEKPNAAEGQE